MQYVDLTSRHIDRLVRGAFRLRVGIIVGPFTVLALLWYYDPVPWRLWALGLALVLGTPIFVYYYLRYRNRPIPARTIVVNLFMMAGLLLIASWVTGAAESPLLYPGFVMIVAGALVLPRRRYAVALASGLSLCFGAIFVCEAKGWLPHSHIGIFGIGEGYYQNGPYVALKWTVLALALHMTAFVASVSGELHRTAAEELDAARGALLAAHEERIRSLEAMGAKIAHEVRNPLSSIVGLTQVMQRSAQGDAADHLRVIAAEAGRLNAVLDEYLAFARPLQPVRAEAVDLARLLDGLVAAFSARLDAAGARVAREIDASAGPAHGDANKLGQAFFNLIQNAVDALEGRGGTLLVSVHAREGGVEASVADTGAGVPAEVRSRLFTPFLTTKPRGTGLGLVIARGAIESCGGRLAVESEPGTGTRARVWLPAWTGREEAGDKGAAAGAAPAARGAA